MEGYKERMVSRKRRTNLRVILKKHNIKQQYLAQESDMENCQISGLCTGKKDDIMLSSAKRICNAINNILGEEEMKYNLHDVFGD